MAQRSFCVAAALGAALLMAGSAFAQSYPSRPIKVIVAQGPGGTADIMARLVGERLAKRLGQPVYIENRVGAGGVLGTEQAAQADPDGYTLYLSTGAPLGIVPAVKKVSYDPVASFEHITLAATLPLVLAVHPDVPARTLKEFIAYAKANPGKLNFGSSGSGSVTQLSCELVKSMAGIEMVHIPFRGSAGSAAALLGGQIQVACADASILENVAAGQVRAIAVTTAKRTEIAPTIPTMQEEGLAGYEAFAWLGFSAPARTPPEIVKRLQDEISQITGDETVRAQLLKRGIEATSTTPEAFKAYVGAELDKWTKLIRDTGLKLD